MIKLGILLLILNFNLMAETVGPDGCIKCGKDPLAKGEVEKALGVDPSKIDVPKLQYKGFITLEELKKYDANTLAELIVDKIRNGCDQVRGDKDGQAVEEFSEIMLFANDFLWDSISKYGFQNQHVTASTGGCDCRERRLSAETTLGGTVVGYGSKSKDILPKYSALNVKKDGHFSKTYAPSQYGNTAVVLKKDVYSRTTITESDSLGIEIFNDYPSASSISLKSAPTSSERKYNCNYSYCEAQIWGKLTLDDVEYLLIPPGKQVPEVFKKRGIPVYFMQQNSDTSIGWGKGDIAFDPSKEKVTPFKNEEIKKTCEGCNDVVRRINDHHNFPKWTLQELMERYKVEPSLDQKREILGEIILRDFETEEKKIEFLQDQYGKVKDVLSSSYSEKHGLLATIILHGLTSLDPKKTKLKEYVLDILNNKDDFIPRNKTGDYRAGLPDNMALVLAAELPGLKDDKDIAKALIEFFKFHGYSGHDFLKQFFYSLITENNRCTEIPKDFVAFLREHYGIKEEKPVPEATPATTPTSKKDGAE